MGGGGAGHSLLLVLDQGGGRVYVEVREIAVANSARRGCAAYLPLAVLRASSGSSVAIEVSLVLAVVEVVVMVACVPSFVIYRYMYIDIFE